MNIEADFEQLDIGEEPIFERNLIKKTSTNQLKDKMSHLQYSYATKTLKRQVRNNIIFSKEVLSKSLNPFRF